MPEPAEVNADQLAFWNGSGGAIWVARQTHTDQVLAPVSDAFITFAAPRAGQRVLDVGCGCGATTLDIARTVGPSGRVTALDISGPMLTEGALRAATAGLDNIEWIRADAAAAPLEPYDLLVSAFGVMFFGDPVAAFAHMRRAAAPGARMAFVCWRPLADNPWMQVPMQAVAAHLPPRPPPVPHSPGMFAFADPQRLSAVLTAAGWAAPRVERLDLPIDIAAGKGLDAAVVQSTQIGAVNSWLRNQPIGVAEAATASLREAIAPYAEGMSVRMPASVWLVASTPA